MPIISIFGVVDDRMKAGSLRRCLSLLLVVSLLAPGPGAHTPSTPSSNLARPRGRPQAPRPGPGRTAGSRGLTRAIIDRRRESAADVQSPAASAIRQHPVVDAEGVIRVAPLGRFRSPADLLRRIAGPRSARATFACGRDAHGVAHVRGDRVGRGGASGDRAAHGDAPRVRCHPRGRRHHVSREHAQHRPDAPERRAPGRPARVPDAR
jgi:hypothetical protein